MKVLLKINEENEVIGYFCIFKKSPYSAVAYNFDELTDKKSALKMTLEELPNLEEKRYKVEDGNLIEIVGE